MDNLKKDSNHKEESSKVAGLLGKLGGGLISTNLIKALNDAGMNSFAMELVSRPSNPQFMRKDKIEQAIKKQDYKKVVELISDIKEGMFPSEEIIIELMLKAYSNPDYKFEKNQLKRTMKMALNLGQYKTAYLCSEFLNDQDANRMGLSRAAAHEPAITIL